MTPGRPLNDFGALLHQTWCLKRTLSTQVSTAAIDRWYEQARAAGAIGGKLLGAGGGGFLLLMVPPDRRRDVCRAVPDLRPVPFQFETDGFAGVAAPGVNRSAMTAVHEESALAGRMAGEAGARHRRRRFCRQQPRPEAARAGLRRDSADAAREYDLLDQQQVRRMFADIRPEMTVHLAARSAGILANTRFPAEFCYQNLLMNTCVLHEAHQAGVRRYVTLIGGCSYPAHAPSPIREEELWNGYPQAESAPYSLAKRMDVVMAGAYRQQYGFDAIVLLAGNLYGPGDNFNLEASHVIPATIRKMVEATERGDKVVTVWGTGTPVRDFVFIDDVCDVMLSEAQSYSSGEIMNISSGVPTTIRELIETVADLCGYQGTDRVGHVEARRTEAQGLRHLPVPRPRSRFHADAAARGAATDDRMVPARARDRQAVMRGTAAGRG